ncbi:prephenate dehydrogenase [Planctomicrobium sp. SH668]|uniref:prephenate dehydrogenase n=1 Tax=Planctomicrobium sp. SH668 TaxID=3448126 RepID=UPI003F5ADF8B
MSNPSFSVERLGVVGVGLIGGSIAATARTLGLAKTIVGYGRNASRLEAARELGVIDEVASGPEGLAECDLVVVCTPVNRIISDVLSVLRNTPETTLVTDAGSVKEEIVNTVWQEETDKFPRFVGAHPVAGSHLAGFENFDTQLFQGRMCVLTPTDKNSPETIETIRNFWRALGMRTREMSGYDHDRILALTSHLPHLAAAAVAEMVEIPMLEFASTGYRDTTRVAAGDPELWAAIFVQNKVQLAKATDQLMQALQRFRNALALGREGDVCVLLKNSQERRLEFRDRISAQEANK